MAQEKRFWDMSAQEVEEYVGDHGMDAWKKKVLTDREHVDELSRWPNPWKSDQKNPRRQNIIADLNPELAERLRREAGIDPDEDTVGGHA